MAKINQTVRTRVEKSTRIELSAADVLDALRLAGHTIPDNANVSVTVPGGGDWSNTELDLESWDVPLVVKFETVEES